MKERRIHHAFLILLFFAIGLIIYGAITFQVSDVTVDDEKVRSLNNGWSLLTTNSEEKSITLPLHLNTKAQEKTVISYLIPKGLEDFYLLFQTRDQLVQILYNDNIIYQFGLDEVKPYGKTPGSALHFVKIPKTDDSVEKKLTVIVWSPYQGYGGVIKEVQVGSKSACLFYWLKNNALAFFLCIIIFLLSISLLIVYFYYRKFTSVSKNLLYLSLFSFMCSVYSTIETRIPQFFWGNASLFSLITFLMIMLAPIPLIFYFIDSYLNSFKKIYEKIIWIFMLLFIVNCILQITNVLDFMESIISIHIMLVVTIGFTYYAIFRVIKENGKNKNVIQIGIALGILLLCVGIDLTRNYAVSAMDVAKYQRIGFLIFLLLLSRITMGNILELSRQGLDTQRLKKIAYEDDLTGLGNKKKFEQVLYDMENAIHLNLNYGILLFDIYNLRYINDKRGYTVGDKMIRYIARAILHLFSDQAEIFRIGGGEFALLVSKEKESEIELACQRFFEELDNMKKEIGFVCEIAYGSAYYNPNEDFDLNSTFVRADSELYLFKKKLILRARKSELV